MIYYSGRPEQKFLPNVFVSNSIWFFSSCFEIALFGLLFLLQGSFNDVTYVYDGTCMTGVVNGDIKSAALTGTFTLKYIKASSRENLSSEFPTS